MYLLHFLFHIPIIGFVFQQVKANEIYSCREYECPPGFHCINPDCPLELKCAPLCQKDIEEKAIDSCKCPPGYSCTASNCPAGQNCVSHCTEDKPWSRPSCETLECPQGLHCVEPQCPANEICAPHCVDISMTACEKYPCPPDHRCIDEQCLFKQNCVPICEKEHFSHLPLHIEACKNVKCDPGLICYANQKSCSYNIGCIGNCIPIRGNVRKACEMIDCGPNLRCDVDENVCRHSPELCRVSCFQETSSSDVCAGNPCPPATKCINEKSTCINGKCYPFCVAVEEPVHKKACKHVNCGEGYICIPDYAECLATGYCRAVCKSVKENPEMACKLQECPEGFECQVHLESCKDNICIPVCEPENITCMGGCPADMVCESRNGYYGCVYKYTRIACVADTCPDELVCILNKNRDKKISYCDKTDSWPSNCSQLDCIPPYPLCPLKIYVDRRCPKCDCGRPSGFNIKVASTKHVYDKLYEFIVEIKNRNCPSECQNWLETFINYLKTQKVTNPTESSFANWYNKLLSFLKRHKPKYYWLYVTDIYIIIYPPPVVEVAAEDPEFEIDSNPTEDTSEET